MKPEQTDEWVEGLVSNHANTVDRWLRKGRTIGESTREANREALAAITADKEKAVRQGKQEVIDKLRPYVNELEKIRSAEQQAAEFAGLKRIIDEMLGP